MAGSTDVDDVVLHLDPDIPAECWGSDGSNVELFSLEDKLFLLDAASSSWSAAPLAMLPTQESLRPSQQHRATKKQRRNVVMDEVSMLREKAQELAIQLQQLTQRLNNRNGKPHHHQYHCMESSPWYRIAKRQLREKQHALLVNAQLRDVYDRQFRLLRSLASAVLRAPQQSNAFMAPHALKGAELACFAFHMIQEDDTTFEWLSSQVDALYAQADTVLCESGLTHSTAKNGPIPQNDLSLQRVRVDAQDCIYVELADAIEFPFDLTATSDAVWSLVYDLSMQVNKCSEEDGIPSVIDATSNMLRAEFTVPITLRAGDIMFHSRLVGKQFVERDRVVLVWCTMDEQLQGKAASSPCEEHLQLRREGWTLRYGEPNADNLNANDRAAHTPGNRVSPVLTIVRVVLGKLSRPLWSETHEFADRVDVRVTSTKTSSGIRNDRRHRAQERERRCSGAHTSSGGAMDDGRSALLRRAHAKDGVEAHAKQAATPSSSAPRDGERSHGEGLSESDIFDSIVQFLDEEDTGEFLVLGEAQEQIDRLNVDRRVEGHGVCRLEAAPGGVDFFSTGAQSAISLLAMPGSDSSELKACATQLRTQMPAIGSQMQHLPQGKHKLTKQTARRVPRSVNHSRVRAKWELEALRLEVVELQLTLSQAKQVTDKVKSPVTAHENNAPISAFSTRSILWERIAKHQRDQRLRSEEVNLRLKNALQTQIKIAQCISRNLRKRPHVAGLNLSLSSAAKAPRFADDLEHGAHIFAQLARQLDSLYAQLPSVLADTESARTCVETRSLTVHPDEQLHGRECLFHVRMLGKQIVGEANRHVVVWCLVAEEKVAKRSFHRRIVFRESAWTTMEEIQVPDISPCTRIHTVVRMTPDSKNDSNSQENALVMFRDMVKCSFSQNIEIMRQHIENAALRHLLATGFGFSALVISETRHGHESYNQVHMFSNTDIEIDQDHHSNTNTLWRVTLCRNRYRVRFVFTRAQLRRRSGARARAMENSASRLQRASDSTDASLPSLTQEEVTLLLAPAASREDDRLVLECDAESDILDSIAQFLDKEDAGDLLLLGGVQGSIDFCQGAGDVGVVPARMGSVSSDPQSGTQQVPQQRETPHEESTRLLPKSASRSRKEELRALRLEVTELQTQLDEAKQAKDSSRRGLPSGTSGENDLVTAGIVLWERIAKHQRDQRLQSEIVNHQLKAALEAQLKITQTISRNLRKRSHLGGLDLLPSSTAKALQPAADRRHGAGIYAQLARRLKMLYVQLPFVLADTDFSNACAETRTMKVHNDGQYLQVIDVAIVPFSLQVASASMWQVWKASSLKIVHSTRDTVRAESTATFTCQGRERTFLVRMLAKLVLNEANRHVLIWCQEGEEIATKKQNPCLKDRVVIRQNVWVTMEETQVPDRVLSQPRTRIHTIVRLTCDTVNPDQASGPANNLDLEAIKDVVEGTLAKNFERLRQRIESIALTRAHDWCR
ncbi:hypothetical protein FI667_g9348, partial [Globisporangium splendens]